MAENNTSVRVALRIRPPLTREIIDSCQICTSVTPGVPQVWIGKNHAFTYDYVFDSDSKQEAVFETIQDLVDGCLDGYNATILAYGQTGSGKTYTMGTGFDVENGLSKGTVSDAQGIIPRAVHYLFSRINDRLEEATSAGHPPPDFKVTAQFVELYNEEVFDLIDPEVKTTSAGGRRPQTAGSIRIHEDPSGGIYLVGIRVKTVESAEATLQCLRDGALSRTTASTNMNDQSSRSHAIFTLHIKQQRVISGDQPESQTEFETLTAKFHFVDLAGSERLKRTGAVGERAREGITINMGLLALGNVISALGDTSKKALHIPYRDSKLTRLLQDSLGGNSRTVMIACISPCDRDFVETLNTLKYANRARNIKNRITVNQDKSSRTIALLKQEVQSLQNELMEYRQGKRVAIGEEMSDTWQENLMLHTEISSLKKRIQAMQETIDMLTTKSSELLAERVVNETLSSSPSADGSNADLTKLIQSYMQEIEQLRAKLMESNAAYESVKKSLSPRPSFSPRPATTMSHNYSDLIEEAKREVEKEKDMLQQIKNTCSDSDSDSDEEEDDTENDTDPTETPDYQLASLTTDISVKTRLIEQLEASQKRIELMRLQYEEKLTCLATKIRSTEAERDKVLGSTRGEDKLKQVKEDYEKKLESLKGELKKWQGAQKEHARVLRNQSNYERQISSLKTEVENMKRTKVKLMQQIKDDGMRWRQIETRRLKEINQLKKEQRKKDIAIRALEGEARKKEMVLKRKHEEVNALKRIKGMSAKASGQVQHKVSPVKAKQRWARIKDHMVRNVTNRQTVSNLEQDMLSLINERKDLKKEVENLIKDRTTAQINNDNNVNINVINEDIENNTAKLAYIDEKVNDLQQTIMELTSGRDEEENPDLSQFMQSLNLHEVGYIFTKMYEQNVSSMTDCTNAATREMEVQEKLTHMERELFLVRDLLQHLMLNTRDNVFLPNELLAKFQSLKTDYSYYPMSESAESVSSGSETQFAKPAVTTVRNEKKARRLTSTPSELLLGCGAGENPAVQESESSQRIDDLKSFQGVNTVRGSFRGRRNTYVVPDSETYASSVTAGSSSSLQASVDSLRSASINSNRRNAPPPPTSVVRLKPSNNSNASDGMNATFVVDHRTEHDRYESPSNTPPGSPNTQRRTNNDNNVFLRLCGSHGMDTGGIGVIRPVRSASNRSILINTAVAEGHSKPVLSVFATEDKLFTGSKDSTAKIWDLNTASEIQSLVGHPNNVLCVRFLKESNLVVTTSHCYIKFWDLRMSGKMSASKTLYSSGGVADDSVKFDPSNRINLLPAGEQLVNCVAANSHSMFTPFGERVRRWDLRKFQSVGLLAGRHGSNVTCMDVDGISFVSGSKDHSIKVYECSLGNNPGEPTSTTQYTMEPPHYDGVETFAISNRILLSGSRDTCIKRWDLDKKEMVTSINNAHGSWITGLVFAPNNDSIFLSSGRDGIIKMWNLNDCREIGKVDAHKGAVNCMASNSSLVFTGSQDDTVKIWRLRRSLDMEGALDLSP